MPEISTAPWDLLSKTLLEIEYQDTDQPSGVGTRPLSIQLWGLRREHGNTVSKKADLVKKFELHDVFTCSALFLKYYLMVPVPSYYAGLDGTNGTQLLIKEATPGSATTPKKFQLVIRNRVFDNDKEYDNELNVRILKRPEFPWWKWDPDPNPIELSDTIKAQSEKTYIVDFDKQVALWFWKKIE